VSCVKFAVLQYLLMEKDNFHVHIFSVFVKEVFEEVGHRIIGDMSTHNYMSANRRQIML